MTNTAGWLNTGPKDQDISNGPENKPCEGLGSLETLFPAPRLRSHTQHRFLIGRRSQAASSALEPVLCVSNPAPNICADAVLQLQVKTVGSAISSLLLRNGTSSVTPQEQTDLCSGLSRDHCELRLSHLTSSTNQLYGGSAQITHHKKCLKAFAHAKVKPDVSVTPGNKDMPNLPSK